MAASKTSPVQRTMRALREQGAICEKVEYWNPHGGARKPDGTPVGNRHDPFGFIDIEVIAPGRGILAIQCCGQSFSAHMKKLTDDCAESATAWLMAGGLIEIWSWRQVKIVRGGKAMRWQPRIVPITMEVFQNET